MPNRYFLVAASALLSIGAAQAEPATDTIKTIGPDYCEAYNSTRECLADFRREMAKNHGWAVAARAFCPPALTVTDENVWALRTKKYGKTAAFAEGQKAAKKRMTIKDELAIQVVCGLAATLNPRLPEAYHKQLLVLNWTDEDQRPRMTEDKLAAETQSFRQGYHDALCEPKPSCVTVVNYSYHRDELGHYRSNDPRPDYRRGWDAGWDDWYRAKRKGTSP